MTRNMPVLGLVPARAGSKGIVGKNMRLIDGDPMIAHTLKAARESGVIDRLVVSTEGKEIAQWCTLHGYEVLDRPEELATDEITIAQVTRHVIDELEWDGIVVALLPTSPLRGPEAIRRAVERAQTEEIDSLASVVREPKLFWYDESEGLDNPKPLYAARVNRQYGKHGVLRETGAILLVTTEALRSGGEMVGERHRLFELDHDEGLDIDAYDDLVVARRISEQGRIVFRISANWEVGSGHLWSCLALAEELTEHNCAFLLYRCDPFVTEMLDARGYEWMAQGDDLRSDLDTMKNQNGSSRNLLVNDMLDTTEEDVLIARTLGYKVVNVDDLGPGARFADWVVNPLYPGNFADASHISSGSKWNQTARDFHNVPPRVSGASPSGSSCSSGARTLALLGPLRHRPPRGRPGRRDPGDHGPGRRGPGVPARDRPGPQGAEHGGRDAGRRPGDHVRGPHGLRVRDDRHARHRPRGQRPRGDARPPRAGDRGRLPWPRAPSSTASSSCPSCGACSPTTSCARISASACGSPSTPSARSASHTKSAD